MCYSVLFWIWIVDDQGNERAQIPPHNNWIWLIIPRKDIGPAVPRVLLHVVVVPLGTGIPYCNNPNAKSVYKAGSVVTKWREPNNIDSVWVWSDWARIWREPNGWSEWCPAIVVEALPLLLLLTGGCDKIALIEGQSGINISGLINLSIVVAIETVVPTAMCIQ